MKYYLVKLLTNTALQDGSKVEGLYTDKERALTAYHQLAASLHNAPDVYYAAVELLNQDGVVVISEIVNHIPAPQPEPEPQTEE